MSDLFSSREAEAAIARIEQQVAEAQLRAEQAQQVQVDIEATSPRREVSVTVDATGRLVGIRLADAAFDDALERVIVETAGDAQRLAGEQALETDSAVAAVPADGLPGLIPWRSVSPSRSARNPISPSPVNADGDDGRGCRGVVDERWCVARTES